METPINEISMVSSLTDGDSPSDLKKNGRLMNEESSLKFSQPRKVDKPEKLKLRMALSSSDDSDDDLI